jgi:hypothetical protein
MKNLIGLKHHKCYALHTFPNFLGFLSLPLIMPMTYENGSICKKYLLISACDRNRSKIKRVIDSM